MTSSVYKDDRVRVMHKVLELASVILNVKNTVTWSICEYLALCLQSY